jgi:hypothetical protein
MATPDLSSLTVGGLLSDYRAILSELRRRGVVRTDNAPTGDYAEYLIARLVDGELAPNSEKSWDLRAADGRLIQVKARLSPEGSPAATRQLSFIRHWDFDLLAVVLFDDDYSVRRAVLVPRDAAMTSARRVELVNGDRVIATDEFLGQSGAVDITEELRAVATEV